LFVQPYFEILVPKAEPLLLLHLEDHLGLGESCLVSTERVEEGQVNQVYRVILSDIIASRPSTCHNQPQHGS